MADEESQMLDRRYSESAKNTDAFLYCSGFQPPSVQQLIQPTSIDIDNIVTSMCVKDVYVN